MTAHDQPFDSGRPRPIVTALDTLRRHIDHDAFDAAVLSLDAVIADLGYGDVRALPGSVAWIDRLRAEGKRIAVVAGHERASTALDLAGVDDRIDVVVTGLHAQRRLLHALEELGVEPDRVIVWAWTRRTSKPRAPRRSSWRSVLRAETRPRSACAAPAPLPW